VEHNLVKNETLQYKIGNEAMWCDVLP